MPTPSNTHLSTPPGSFHGLLRNLVIILPPAGIINQVLQAETLRQSGGVWEPSAIMWDLVSEKNSRGAQARAKYPPRD